MKDYNSYYSDDIVERVLKNTHYFLNEMCTVREVAEWSGCSKSTVHDDLAKKLQHINHELYTEVQILLELNKEERNYRGGKAVQKTKKQSS